MKQKDLFCTFVKNIYIIQREISCLKKTANVVRKYCFNYLSMRVYNHLITYLI